MKTHNSLSNLMAHLGRTQTSGLDLTSLVRPAQTSLSEDLSKLSKRLSTFTRDNTLKAPGLGVDRVATGIQFGSPSNPSTKTNQSQGEWSNLLKQTASGGAASLLGGGLLSAVGGLGGIITGFANLFGGSKKTLPSLVRFTLPASESYTSYVSTHRTSNFQGSVSESPGPQNPAAGIYSSSSKLSIQQNQQVVNAVKQALLNSSSLNDVIAEI